MEEHEFYSGLIIKIGASCFFCNQEGHFRMDCSLFWEAVKNQSHPKHKVALAAVQNQRNRQTEFETKKFGGTECGITDQDGEVCNACQQCHGGQGHEFSGAAAEAINKVKQDLATKEIEPRLKQEIERQKLKETLSGLVPKPEAEVGATKSGNCNTLNMMTESHSA